MKSLMTLFITFIMPMKLLKTKKFKFLNQFKICVQHDGELFMAAVLQFYPKLAMNFFTLTGNTSSSELNWSITCKRFICFRNLLLTFYGRLVIL